MGQSWNYWTMRNTITFQRPLRRIVDVSKRSWDNQQREGK